jgi:hypothetical protein
MAPRFGGKMPYRVRGEHPDAAGRAQDRERRETAEIRARTAQPGMAVPRADGGVITRGIGEQDFGENSRTVFVTRTRKCDKKSLFT